ncbi:peroxisomal biogenesis factor 11 [Didymella exigua CBS 183.55]|uniref:Peroxisomal biogenesis factor 11 n=1 Tax=Didymella exigua CBS 183.55 TaxID=1150837 RepID=A0A6A5RFX9_9PLEO|nr:peroxisomal biogenesis factor 11 [Didymella exigua CBS 183.55]KAF1926004.1 peroxisomal biogenesis factor 11 [Didymella exigua CBS 183.55]
MVADALVYHPTVSHYLKFVATTVGRDKVLRTVQYFSRFLAWYLYRTNRPLSSIAPFDAAKKQLGTARKLMRVGKFVEHFKAAAVASDNASLDPVIKATSVGRQLGYAFYMLLDSANILDATGIRKAAHAPALLRTANKAWLSGISFSLAQSLYALYGLRARGAVVAASADPEKVVELKKVAREWDAVRVQLLSDLCDITIPATALGWVQLDDGIVGLAGTTSSLLGVWAQWKKTA